MNLYDDVCYKEQFRLKLGLEYLIATETSIFGILGLMLLDSSFGTFLSLYFFIMLIYYYFFFSATKDGGHFRVFAFEIMGDIKQKITLLARKSI